MSLVRYEPWVGVRQLQDDINRLFSGLSTGDSSGATADWVPNVDINEFEDKFQLYVDLPGVDPKDVDISVQGDELALSGKVMAEAEAEGESWHRRERPAGEFARKLQLPFRADANGVRANYSNGVLRLTIPRSEEEKPKRIAIEAA